MASPEVAACFNAMTHNMGNKLAAYQEQLQWRYGDPRVYAAQQQHMREDEMRVLHSRKTKTAELLQSAYAERTENNRRAHNARMTTRHQTVASPQESDLQPPVGHKPAPRKRVSLPPPIATPSAA